MSAHPSASAHHRAVDAVLDAVQEEQDFSGWLAGVLAAAAARLGRSEALIHGRAGSWEADLVRRLVAGTVGWQDENLAYFKDDDAPLDTRQEPRERAARPGELCDCGRPAMIVYLTQGHGEVPWCGLYDVDEPSTD